MGAQLAPAHHDGRGSRIEHLLAASWCATVAPERAARADLPGRRRALGWVAGALTRSGFPRAVRIAMCGRPRAVCRDGDWRVSWVHQHCNDRACPACAAKRSRQLAVSIRSQAEKREGRPLYFVTLTRPKVEGESANAAWCAYQHAWEAFRHRPEFKQLAGGVRVVEVTRNGSGWHVHCHCIFELKPQHHVGRGRKRWHVDNLTPIPCPACDGSQQVARAVRNGWRMKPCQTCSTATMPGDGTMPAALAAALRCWTNIVDGKLAAQCGVRLDDRNAGQLAKYLTKLWELDDDSARRLFQAAEGRRLLNTFGTWRGVRIRGKLPDDARRWFMGPLLAEVESLHPRSYVYFEGTTVGCSIEAVTTSEVESARNVPNVVSGKFFPTHVKRSPVAAARPTIPIARMTAGALLRYLREDQRRADEHGPAPPDLPMPGLVMCRRAGGGYGPWSPRYKRRKVPRATGLRL